MLEQDEGVRADTNKEGLANLASAITSMGDQVIVPNPSYPIHPYGFIIAGASVLSIDSLPDEKFIKNLHAILSSSNNKAKALVLNYPNNPTAANMSLDEMSIWVKKALEFDFVLLNDECYSEIYFDEENKEQKCEGFVVDFIHINKAEYLVLKDGFKLRLDKIIQFNDIVSPSTSSCNVDR